MESSSTWRPDPTDVVDWCVAVALGLAAFALLVVTDGMGIPRDESFYFHAGGDYAGWFEEMWKNWHNGELWQSFTKSNVDRHWSYNTEHPSLMKTLFGLSHLLFYHGLDWLSHATAYRLPGMATGASAVGAVYLFGRQVFGRTAGIVAALALFLQPRYFFHAHLACFDVPITFFWLAVVYAYWRSFASRGWAVATGLLWGLALCTKLNAFFLPPVLVLHWLLVYWSDLRFDWNDGNWRVELPDIPRAFLWMALLGPLVFYALNPRFWFETFDRVGKYMGFHAGHAHYFVRYFGENVMHPPLPISYPWVMTLLTVPATLLVAAAFGGVRAALIWDPVDLAKRWGRALRRGTLPDQPRRDPRGTGLLLAINLLFPIALISDPSTPIFGGTKHWMPAMPFLAILAGAGVALAVELFRRRVLRTAPALAHGATAVLVSAAVAVPAGIATAHIHPFGTSYYNEFIGGIRGAADHRMFRQFWGYASRQGLPWLNENAPKRSSVWTHNTTGFAWWFYRDSELVRDDLRSSSLRGSDFALYHHQKAFGFRLDNIWRNFDTRAPAHVVSVEGVPLLSIYRGRALRSDD